jgi:phospholipid transport system substrate-binding protein
VFIVNPYNHLKSLTLYYCEKMKKTYERNIDVFIAIFLLLSILISSLALAETGTPEVKVKTVFGQIESALVSLKNEDKFVKSNIRDVLELHLMPEINTQFFSNKVLGKNLTKVPKELKGDFVTELSLQLINSYSQLLSKYNNETINIGASSLSKSGKMASVKITIVGKIKTNNAVVKLLKSTDGNWQFFDIIIEGISILDAKQKEINSSIHRLGVEGTLSHLKSVNQKSISSS